MNTFAKYFTVPSVNDYASKIEEVGDKITIPIIEIPDREFIVLFVDIENNLFVIHEEMKK